MRDSIMTQREELSMLPTEILDAMLQQELKKRTPNEEVVRSILDILRNRETCDYLEIDGAVETAWKRFQDNQLPKEEKHRKQEKTISFRRKLAALVVAACLIAVGIPVAFGKTEIFTAVARWTKEFFSFSSLNDIGKQDTYSFKTDNPDLQKVYEKTKELGMQENFVPTWLPEKFVLKSIENIPVKDGKKIVAHFTDGKDNVVLSFAVLSDGTFYYEKEEESAEIYEIEGIVHYIVPNQKSISAVWFRNNCECVISTSLEKGELLQMLNSIYEEV